jgi:hypothetical protein
MRPMTTLDRRTLVTGLAAIAVAGVTPALPASAAPLIRTGLVFRRGEYAFDWSEDILQTALSERWHYQQWGFPDHTICHCATRLMFTCERGRTDGIELIRAAGATVVPLDEAELDHIGHAARHASVLAGLPGLRRKDDEGRDGAFFFWHRDEDIHQITTEDAPPLPRFAT